MFGFRFGKIYFEPVLNCTTATLISMVRLSEVVSDGGVSVSNRALEAAVDGGYIVVPPTNEYRAAG